MNFSQNYKKLKESQKIRIMKQLRWKVLVISGVFFFMVFTDSCASKYNHVDVQELSSTFVVLDRETGIAYFSYGEDLYAWKPGGSRVERATEDLFYPNEKHSLTLANGKVFTVRWDTGVLTSFDLAVGERNELVKVFDWEENSYCGDIWSYNGNICNIIQSPHDSCPAKVQIWSPEGELLETVELPVHYTVPLFAYKQYLFYLEYNYFSPGHMLNLKTGEDISLGIYWPLTIYDDQLAVIQWAEYDDDGGYRRMEVKDPYLIDKAGTVSPSPQLKSGSWEVLGRFFTRDSIFYRYEEGEPEALFLFEGHILSDCSFLDDILYFKISDSFEIISDRITMSDATGENAEAVAEASETRMVQSGGCSLIFALTPDDTLYLLHVGEVELRGVP